MKSMNASDSQDVGFLHKVTAKLTTGADFLTRIMAEFSLAPVFVFDPDIISFRDVKDVFLFWCVSPSADTEMAVFCFLPWLLS